MEYSFIIAVIPVILVVAFLVWIAKKITDGERLDMKEGVLGVVILMVAVLIMVPMISSTQVYTWDDDTGELVIQQNISGGSYAWDTYDDQIRSIVIKPGVTQIGNSAFDGATNLEYLSIPESVTDIGTNAFGVSFYDEMDTEIATASLAGHEFVGDGSGELFVLNMSQFDYLTTSSGVVVNRVASGHQSDKNFVLPYEKDGQSIYRVGSGVFQSNTSAIRVLCPPMSEIRELGDNVCNGATALQVFMVPTGVTTMPYFAFHGCTSLESISIPAITVCSQDILSGCTSLESLTIADGCAVIGVNFAAGCTSLTSVYIPDSVQEVRSQAFSQCTSLADLRISANVSNIPYRMAYHAPIENLVIPSSVRTIESNAFTKSATESLALPEGLQTIGSSAFSESAIKSISFPSSLTSIGASAFSNNPNIEAATFASGFAPTLGQNWAAGWTFYASDGTTTIDKTNPANLAGKTFQGTAAALIEVEPGQLTLTPQQIQQVHLHDTELQDLKDQISIEPLPLQPSLQEQELTA